MANSVDPDQTAPRSDLCLHCKICAKTKDFNGNLSEADVDHVDGAVTFESIPKTELLDTSANRGKAQLASAIPSRRPPTKSRSKVHFSY